MTDGGASLLNRKTLQFLAIFETGNIYRAAERLRISQPALSMSLRQLEDELGLPLFDRLARGVEPTEAGKILYRYASSIRQGAKLASEEIAALATGSLSKLRLGAGVAWTTTVLPPILRDLRATFPSMSIDVLTGVGDQLATWFMEGEIDVFLAAGSMPQLDTPEIVKEFIGNMPMLAVADPGNALCVKEIVTPADLVAADWAGFYDDEGFFHLAKHFMSLRGLPSPKITMRTNSAAALTALVQGSDLVSILSAPLANSAGASNLSVLHISEPLWETPVNIYFRSMMADLGALKVFRERVRVEIPNMTLNRAV